MHAGAFCILRRKKKPFETSTKTDAKNVTPTKEPP